MKSQTADLFAANDVLPASTSVAELTFDLKTHIACKAGGVPPIQQTAIGARSKQLWYAVVFPQLSKTPAAVSLLQRLCLSAQRFTSFVSIEPPNALLLEIKGSVKLFGSLKSLHADLDTCWRRLNHLAHSAMAPSTLAALWLARAAVLVNDAPVQIEQVGMLPGHLAGLPITCTAWDMAQLQTLRTMGVTRVGELLRLPRAGVARRLGIKAVQELDIALARQFAPRRAFVPHERFRARCNFDMEIDHVAYLEQALEPLILSCAQFLRERQAGIQTLQLKLWHRTQPATCVQVGLASVTSERRRLKEVLTQKLAKLRLAAPVRSMALIGGCLQPLCASSLDVFARSGAASRGCDTAPQLVERLRARLGECAVYGIVSIPEHRPEAAWRRVQQPSLISSPSIGEISIDPKCGNGMLRPVWLLETPSLLTGDLVLQQGPERIESGWWDAKGVARDYYIAYQASAACPYGAKWWVFQDRQSKCWYLHGVFA